MRDKALLLRTRWVAWFMLLGVLMMLVSAALAQSGGGYDLSWNTVDGGGLTFAAGGSYRLGGTAGQADTGTMIGGVYTLSGGFWAGWPAMRYRVYLPLVLRSYHP